MAATCFKKVEKGQQKLSNAPKTQVWNIPLVSRFIVNR